MWQNYPQFLNGKFDEYLMQNNEEASTAGNKSLHNFITNFPPDELCAIQNLADVTIKEQGITFTVYDENMTIDRLWPFDVIPRIISASEWGTIKQGLKQRLNALNAFINDIYHNQQIFHDGIVPFSLLETSKNYRPECRFMNLPYNTWAHICGTDLIRHSDGQMYVLEDNLRVPSGVSYMLENRGVSKRTFPELFTNARIQPVDEYPAQLYSMLSSLSQESSPEIVILTPGVYNSAYYEHAFLAMEMGCELVEGADLTVENDKVYMRTVSGKKKVDVIYRRVDDLFLDPEVFNKDSALGVSGLMRAWKAGNVAIANAPGAGVADDKVIYSYVPEIIRYYLNEEPLINNVPTYRCIEPDDCQYVISHLHELFVKPANESGGYGMLYGPNATQQELEKYRNQILNDPRNYIAQPVINLSTVPTIVGKKKSGVAIRDSEIKPRHVDLRPFILSAGEQYVTNGGLTRVALVENSLVVNSSQGGGSKDTLIVSDEYL